MNWVGVGSVFVCVLAASNAGAADISQIGPNASPDALIKARPAMQELALEFAYKIEGGNTPGTITVDLAQDYTDVVRDRQIVIQDFALRRVIVLDDASRGFGNTSLYGMVDFLVAETFNRRYERRLLSNVQAGNASAAAITTAAIDPFWSQSELHVMAPEDGKPSIDRHVDAGGTVHFSYAGTEIASYLPSTQVLTADIAAKFARFLRTEASVHPVIIDDIAASLRLPQHLTYTPPPMWKKPQAVWTLQSAVPVKALYPLRVGNKPTSLTIPGDAGKVLGALIPVMTAAVAGQAPGLRKIEEYRAAIEAAMTAEKPFQAALLGLELNEQYGPHATDCAKPAGCHMLKEIFAAAESDPRTAVLIKALQPARGEMDAATKVLKETKRDDLSNPYVLDDFLANSLVATGHTDEALPLFAAAIKGNPYMAGYYKDLGDLYRVGFQPGLAWLCYDLGRALPGGPNAPVISLMNDYETDLAKRYPEFF